MWRLYPLTKWVWSVAILGVSLNLLASVLYDAPSIKAWIRQHGFWMIAIAAALLLLTLWSRSSWMKRQAGLQVEPVPTPFTDLNNRKIVLENIRRDWIEGVLNKSLETVVWLDLGLEKRSAAVERP